MDPVLVTLELLGVFFSLVACLCSLVTLMMPQWLTLNTELLPSENFQLGLWETCVVQDFGATECLPYTTLLGLPLDIRLARILMCTTVATGLLSLFFTIPGINLVNSCRRTDSFKAKRTLKMLGGIFSIIAGVLGLVPVSYVAHLTVLHFFDKNVPKVVPRWEFGDMLFLGWTAGCLHLAAGSLLVTSCLFSQDETCSLHQSIALNRAHMKHPERSQRGRTEYV
ncbi:claudin-22-like [Garra rufa]|uniref:claudin-22-like n=1 Tax=Garra rufa TaxID=137080 RepID=UPI003CCEB15D